MWLLIHARSLFQQKHILEHWTIFEIAMPYVEHHHWWTVRCLAWQHCSKATHCYHYIIFCHYHFQPVPAKKSNWRAQHEDFINTIRSAKQVSICQEKGLPLPPPPPPSINPGNTRTSWDGHTFYITGPLWGESTDFVTDGFSQSLRASNVELWCFVC